MNRNASRGFTLLEVMVAGALLVFVTAAAMASYVAQLQLTNSQQQSTTATDDVREALRIIGNDLRSAAPGMNAGLLSGGATGTGGAANTQLACPVGTVPYSTGAIPLICIPPIFRSTSPLAQLPLGGGSNNPGQGNCVNPTSPGFKFTFPNGLVEPDPGGALFCPDDLVILAVDDSNPFFVSGLPPSSIPITAGAAGVDPRLLFLPPPTSPLADVVAQTGFDQDGLQAVTGNPLMLISGANGPVLINQPVLGVATPYAGTTGVGATTYDAVPVTLGGTLTDVFGSAGTGYPVAMPARLVQYSIQPVNATDGTVPPFVSANLVRTEVTPLVNSSGAPPLYFANSFSTVLVKGVIDMQVEFGLDPNGTGQLQYVNSGGFQNAPQLEPVAPAPPVAPPTAETSILHVSGACIAGGASGASLGALFPGACFPVDGMQYVRSIKLNLLVRSGNAANSNATNGAVGRGSAVAQAAPFYLQPAGQDLSPNGNLEAQNWGWTFSNTWAVTAQSLQCVGGCNGYPTIDGASYREVSTEIFVRNLGLTNNF